MLTNNVQTTHYTAELALLGRAARGEHQAMHEAIQYLSSANPYLRQIMQTALHECTDPAVWHGLVRCMGEHCWEAGPPDTRLLDAEAAYHLDESIRTVFTEDHTPAESQTKVDVLRACLKDDAECVRYAASCLLGQRSDPDALPALKETLEKGNLTWQLRAVRTLAAINDPGCGPLLIWALSQGRGALHQAAGWVMRQMAVTIHDTLIEALHHPDAHVHWHAARTLVEARDRSGIDMVTEGLFDENRIIRFISAETLASLGEACVPILLNILSRPGLTQPTLQAIGHAFNTIQSHAVRERLHPLLAALQDPTSSTVIPSIAQRMQAGWVKRSKVKEVKYVR
jgi:HEAT repeat protein